jgi:aryl-alcohol dehydrogenase-like predicted oxidoreductase
MLEKRTLGRTGFQVTEIGFGAWAIGGRGYGEVPEEDALAALEAYVTSGGNLIDTARRYGQSERLIGEFLRTRGQRTDLFIASKSHSTTEVEVRADLEEGLRLLGCDHVDLYYLHSPPEDPDEMNHVLDIYERLKTEGLIRAVGASIKGPNVTQATVDLCRQYMRSGRIDALQVIYSIFRQKNSEMFAEAQQRGVGIITRTALESGFLTGKYHPGQAFPAGDHRHRWGQDRLARILRRVEEVEQMAVQPPYDTLPQVAIRFALQPEAVSSVIVGAKSAAQVAENMSAASLPPLPLQTIEALRDRYQGLGPDVNTGE